MQNVHGFYIPKSSFCKDVKGLLEYIHKKLEVGILCLFCDKAFDNLNDV